MSIKVSVIIPVYNSEKFIRETIESVLNQTYYDFEIITVDDGSTDKSADIINSFNDKRISYVYQKNQGISGARNTAISESKGEYIALLDHDDLWLPQKLEKQIPLLENNDKVGLVYSDCYNVDVDEKVIVRSFEQAKPFRGRVLSHLFGTGFIPCLTAVMKKEVFKKSGLFDAKFSIAEEYDLFLRIAKFYEVDYIDSPLAKYRIHETNFSRNVVLTNQEEIEVLNKCLQENVDLKRTLGMKVSIRLAGAHSNLGRIYQLQENFCAARQEFFAAIKMFPFELKPYIGCLTSLLGVVIAAPQKNDNETITY